MLPDRCRADKRDEEWWVTTEEILKPVRRDTETDARAAMLVLLLEYKLVDLPA
jgi:hypothetical protein